jgi:hypothetical protein
MPNLLDVSGCWKATCVIFLFAITQTFFGWPAKPFSHTQTVGYNFFARRAGMLYGLEHVKWFGNYWNHLSTNSIVSSIYTTI